MATNILIRVAWYDRENKKYDFGTWSKFTSKDIKEMNSWIEKQNKSIPKTRYWIEYKNKDSKEIKNIEELKYLKIDDEKTGNNDYLLI